MIYALGDNEWVDCHRYKPGPDENKDVADPCKRLEKLRKLFFSVPGQSLGMNPMPIESQGKVMLGYCDYAENLRVTQHGVLFVGVNIPGFNNGFERVDAEAAAKYFERNNAKIAWIDASFDQTTLTGANAAALAFQANHQNIHQSNSKIPPASGFLDTVKAIEKGAKAFGKPHS